MAATIEAMVERLAERLKKDGSDVAGWIQLVRSYRVLGKADKVKATIADAHTALANDREALQRLDQGLAALEAEAIPNSSASGTSCARNERGKCCTAGAECERRRGRRADGAGRADRHD